jgi:hypothetical protein
MNNLARQKIQCFVRGIFWVGANCTAFLLQFVKYIFKYFLSWVTSIWVTKYRIRRTIFILPRTTLSILELLLKLNVLKFFFQVALCSSTSENSLKLVWERLTCKIKHILKQIFNKLNLREKGKEQNLLQKLFLPKVS